MVWNSHCQLQLELVTYIYTYISTYFYSKYLHYTRTPSLPLHRYACPEWFETATASYSWSWSRMSARISTTITYNTYITRRLCPSPNTYVCIQDGLEQPPLATVGIGHVYQHVYLQLTSIIPTLHADSVPPPTQMCVSRMVWHSHRQLQLELVTYFCTYIYSTIIPTLHADSVPPLTQMCVSRMVRNNHRQLQLELVTYICT